MNAAKQLLALWTAVVAKHKPLRPHLVSWVVNYHRTAWEDRSRYHGALLVALRRGVLEVGEGFRLGLARQSQLGAAI